MPTLFFLSQPRVLSREALTCLFLAVQLPSPPTDDEGDFIFVHHEDVRLSQKAEDVYVQLIKLLRDQYEVSSVFVWLS